MPRTLEERLKEENKILRAALIAIAEGECEEGEEFILAQTALACAWGVSEAEADRRSYRGVRRDA